MRHEYQSLQRFSNDFALCASIRVPQPVAALLRRDILVETFEEGVSVGHILKDTKYSSELKKHLATIGMDALLQMVSVHIK
ncbi:unnamed protein product [Lymnaea stagnalis]|uniref:Uncharacterized protein n=1 Tax=Lymnaea stagnalis TaxID=6523 RepID=A0AAV2IQA4_LYMST